MNKQKEENLPSGWALATIDDITEQIEQRLPNHEFT